MALEREPLFFKKKLTVMGIIGHTQGVSSANKPPRKHAQKIYHSELSDTSYTSLLALSTGLTGAHNWACDAMVIPLLLSAFDAEEIGIVSGATAEGGT